MFNIGPMELLVLAIVGIIVIGPERLPGLLRDAGRLVRALRDVATGARQQLRDELGPEFADIDLRNLNPRTALTKAMFGEDNPDLKKAFFGENAPDLSKYDPRRFDARSQAHNLLFGESDGTGTDSAGGSGVSGRVSMSKDGSSGGSTAGPSANGVSTNGVSTNGSSANGSRPRPRPAPAQPSTHRYDDIA